MADAAIPAFDHDDDGSQASDVLHETDSTDEARLKEAGYEQARPWSGSSLRVLVAHSPPFRFPPSRPWSEDSLCGALWACR